MRLERKPVDGATVVLCCLIYFLGMITIGRFFGGGVYGTFVFDVMISIVCYLVYRTTVQPYLASQQQDSKGILLISISLLFACSVAAFSVGYIQRLVDLYPPVMFAGYEGVPAVCYSILTICIAPIVEELLFRGVIFTYFKRHFHWLLATAFVSVIFGFLHGTEVQLYSCLVMSLFSCLIFHVTGDIKWSVLYHALHNVVMLFVQPIISIPGDMTLYFIMTCVLNCGLIVLYYVLYRFLEKKKRTL